MDIDEPESHAMSKTTEKESANTPSSDDNALMTRLGLLLGDHRASTVKTQTHVHPVLSHHNHVNGIAYPSNERRKKSHLTTSPASTLSDKGIGSSVGSFDSEFRHNLSVLAESNPFQNRTGSLDSRSTEIVSHSRSDSGIPSHSRSSSDIVFIDNTTDVTAGRLAQQSSGKLWNADPRRNNGNTSSVTPPEVKPRRPSTSKARRNSAKSTDSLNEKGDSNNNSVMKLPQLCLDSPKNSTPTSSVTSSTSITPSVSVGDVSNHKLGRRRSSASNGNSAFDNEPLPPPPPPPPSNDNFYVNYEELPPPPPPPPADDVSIHSIESSSDRTISYDDIQMKRNDNTFQYEEQPSYMLHARNLIGKPPISRGTTMDQKRRNDEYANGNAYQYHRDPQTNQIPYNYNQYQYQESTQPSLLQRLRNSSENTQIQRPITSSASDEALRGRDSRRDWPHDRRRDIINPAMQMPHLTSSISSLSIGRPESTQRVIQHERSSSNASRTSSITSNVIWDDGRPHSVSAPPPPNPLLAQNIHRPSASFDNSYFSRRSSNRSSTRSNPGNERRKAMSNASSTTDMRVRFAPFRPPEVNLHPLFFELPSVVTSETKFTGREWVFTEIMTALNNSNSKTNKGVIIIGGEGSGKTALIHHLEAYSYHGNKKISNHNTLGRREQEPFHRSGSLNMSRSGSPVLQPRQYYHPGSNNSSRTASPAPSSVFSGKPGSKNGSQTSLSGEEAHKRLSSQVVAYHYCQADNNTTCYVPEFLQSIAAQLAHAPQLTAYREMLLQEPHLQSMLSLRSCIQSPVQALHKAIMEPLVTLKQLNKLPRLNLVILLDGLSEAEQHRPDYGHSILTFLQRYLPDFPDFIKVIATCRTSGKDLIQQLPMYVISLDIEDNQTNIIRDAQVYVNHRISTSKALANFTLTGKPDVSANQKLLAQHLVEKCHGNILYLRLIIDLLSNGKLMPKSSGFKIIPVNMSEVFLFMCNLKFSSASSFSRVRDILAVALASLYPLKEEELYQAVSAGYTTNRLHKEEFKQLMESLSQFLIPRIDGSRSFIHPCFREWLEAGSFSDNNMGTLTLTKKFGVDARRGHALLATLLSRQPPTRVNEHATLELAHHLLKARMFRGKSKTTGINSSDLHAIWMAQCSLHLNGSLSTVRNLFFPNIKVSKLLIRAGANPNIRSQVLCDAPAICVAAHSGYAEFVELLLTHGATIDFPATNGMTALAYAAAAGHQRVVEMLIKFKPRLDLVDRNGHSPLLHAISHGHSDIATLLLTCDLYVSPEQRKFSSYQALVAAATIGNIQLIQYLLDHPDPALHCDVNSVDPTRGESALSAAAARGKSNICEFLIREKRAHIEQRNKLGMTPLLCAVKQGEWDIADLLLTWGSSIEGPDQAGRTPLITAASNGHLGVLELLLSRGANVEACDKEGLTALGWSALKGHMHCAKSLIEHRSNIHHLDRNGRAPLDLAAFKGDAQVVDLLLEAGSDIARVDNNDRSPLDCAIGRQNVAVVSLLLKHNAVITSTSWALAAGNPDVITALISKSVEGGNLLYKNENFSEAREVYARALNHVGEKVTSQQEGDNTPATLQGHLRDLTTVLLLGLSRCARKLNDLNTAEMASTRALELKPGWYEALYVRARVRRESGRLTAGLRDVEEAEVHAPQHNKKEIARLIERIREELKRSGRRNSLSEATENSLRIPGQRRNSNSGPSYRQRVNSSSSFHGNNSRSSSPSPSVVSEFPISRTFQPQSHLRNYSPKPGRHDQQYQLDFRQLQAQTTGLQDPRNGYMGHSGSQDNMNESRASSSMYQSIEHTRVPYQHRVLPQNQQNAYPNYPHSPMVSSQEFGRSNDTGIPRDNIAYNYPPVNRQSFNNVPTIPAHMQSTPMAVNNADGRRSHNNVPNVQQPYRRTVATEL